MRFAYADPPYPGQAKRHYADHPDYAGEVDHAELVGRLEREYPDGWALSTGSKMLQEVLAFCPSGVRILSWHKPASAPPMGDGFMYGWEPVILAGGRKPVVPVQHKFPQPCSSTRFVRSPEPTSQALSLRRSAVGFFDALEQCRATNYTTCFRARVALGASGKRSVARWSCRYDQRGPKRNDRSTRADGIAPAPALRQRRGLRVIAEPRG